MTPDDVVEDVAHVFGLIERSENRSDRVGADLVPALDQIHQLVDDSAGCGDVAVLAPERQPVAAESDRAMKPLAKRVEDAVLDPGELGRNLVGDVQHLLHRRSVGAG